MIISLPPVRPDLAVVGQRLRAVRQARGLELDDLAQRAHLPAAELSLAETGRARLDSAQLHAVIDALHVSPRILFEPGLDLSRLRRI
jgi:transcriptional regulator with XRE-family HTH domain